ncbi:hypothetical protein LXL04_038433 [Taraxacum kok-saghyz]
MLFSSTFPSEIQRFASDFSSTTYLFPSEESVPAFKFLNSFDVVPPVLTKVGKVKSPWPNVDAHSGVFLCSLT